MSLRATARRALTLLLGAALAVALTACGTVGSTRTTNLSGVSRDVAQTISDLQADVQTRSGAKACTNDLASSLVGRLQSASAKCSDILNKQLNEVDDYTLTLDSGSAITVNGQTATARVKDTASGHKNHIDTVTLVKEGTRWKVQSIA